MRHLSGLRTSSFVMAALGLVGCGEGAVSPQISLVKAEVDLTSLASGVVVTIAGDLGTVTLPFETAVPAVDDARLQTELQAVVSLTVSSPRTGVSASITDGVIVQTPSAPLEFSWSLSAARTAATLTFFNRTDDGASLQPGQDYTAVLSITENLYIQSLATTSFTATVQ